MDVTTFQKKIDEYVIAHSGLQPKRDYLGISAIGKCPRVVVREFLNGKGEMSLQAHQMCYVGYLYERDLIMRLQQMGLANSITNTEVIAPFDPRLRGHTDGETLWGDLVEGKSVNGGKFKKVKDTHMALTEHFAQVQLYMKYGPWKTCWIVYENRETFEHCVVKVPYLHTQAIKYEMKAQRLLAFIDQGIVPECECRYCRD